MPQIPSDTRDESSDDVLLDLFSTSPTTPKICHKFAPFLCIPPTADKPGRLYQLCCNDWQCPRCGELRAKYEYGRMIEGCRTLARRYPLYFVTVTCGDETSLEEAEDHYLEWTNRLLDAYRLHVKRAKGVWNYCSVTERQPKRKFPHSHYITTARPTDAFNIKDHYPLYVASVAVINQAITYDMRFTPALFDDLSHLDLHSEWLMLAAERAGLGVQARISDVDTVEGASRYVAKYLFKESMFTEWRPGWKRVRYSNNFPKLPEAPNHEAFPLLKPADWRKASDIAGDLICYSPYVYEIAQHHGMDNAILMDTPAKHTPHSYKV